MENDALIFFAACAVIFAWGVWHFVRYRLAVRDHRRRRRAAMRRMLEFDREPRSGTGLVGGRRAVLQEDGKPLMWVD